MESITSSDSERKRVSIVRGGLGSVIKGQSEKWHGTKPPARGRGDISGFSRSSQRRLRETLALARPRVPSSVWGLCMTIPGPILSPSEVRHIWHKFVVFIKREFVGVPLVWRIELQTRKQAHWHVVLWAPNEDMSSYAVVHGVAALWRRVVRSVVGVLPDKTERGFDLHGVDIKDLNGASSTGIIGYLCDHQSKRKQAQLGWIGRQWGVVCRSALDLSGEVLAEVTDTQHKQAARQFRRLQDHLRRDNIYTGGGVTPTGNVQRAVFGRDEDRLMLCYEMVLKGGDTREE